ncbi:MAG: hypothetical protein U0841_08125 [Chloroflexia bacterium]
MVAGCGKLLASALDDGVRLWNASGCGVVARRPLRPCQRPGRGDGGLVAGRQDARLLLGGRHRAPLVARGQSNATLKGHEGPAREPVNARRRRAGVGRRRRRCGLSATGEALTTPPIPDNRGGITCLT